MQMMNEKAIEIIATEVPIHDGEVKAALLLAIDALKCYKCMELYPDKDNNTFRYMDPENCLHIYHNSEAEMLNTIEYLESRCQR